MLEIGSVIDNKYRILHEIGKGGMSHVYLALNEAANKEWAIKEIRKQVVINGDEVWQRPMTETTIMKKLRHKHLPQIADVLETDESYLIVMDYIEGHTLRKMLSEDGAQPQEDVIGWAMQLCDVLEYLHSQHPPVIYRDMKPGNIMLKPDGNVMLIDFGAAREFKEGASDDTSCLGTKGYAAPEQYGGEGQTDARTDIYNLGATMYHLVTGKNPAKPPYEMRPIRDWDKSFSSGLEQIISRCTKSDPDERYQTAADLKYALSHYREMEYEYRRKKDRQWRTFIALCSASVFFLIAGAALLLYAGNIRGAAYDELIRRGRISVEKEQQIQAYEEAVKIRPDKSEAYELLLNEVFLSDGVFSQDEADRMTQVLGYRGKNSQKTAEGSLMENREGYDRFCYDMGLAFFYYYEEDGSKQLSLPWFETAKDSRTLAEAQRLRSERFYRIAEYYARLGDRNKSGDSIVSYADYWNDLLTLCRGDIKQQDNLKTAMVMYRELVCQIGAYAAEFKEAGITEDEMTSQLRRVQQFLDENADEIAGTDAVTAKQIEGNIRSAERVLRTVFAE